MTKRIAGQIQGEGLRPVAALLGQSDNTGDASETETALLAYLRQAPSVAETKIPAPRADVFGAENAYLRKSSAVSFQSGVTPPCQCLSNSA